MTGNVSDHEKISIIEKRVSYLVGARLRNKDRIRVAIQKQDEIREKHPAPKGWDSVSTVRKWRENR